MVGAERGSTAWRKATWGTPCRPQTARLVFAPGVIVWIDGRAREAFQALASVVQAHGYAVRPGDTGAYNCRMQKGTKTVASSHSWGTALDLNWLTNPYRRDRLVTDMTRTGAPVFRWGGDWDNRPATPHSNYDAMHWEVIATPVELAAGIDWSTVRMPARHRLRPETWPILEVGDRGPTVAELQRLVGVKADAIFGPATLAAVTKYQASRDLEPDGIVGVGTWTALLTRAPERE